MLIVTLNQQTLKWQLPLAGNHNGQIRCDIYLTSCVGQVA